MDEYGQADAPGEVYREGAKGRYKGKREWRKAHADKAKAQVYRYREKHSAAYREYMRGYMANRRKAQNADAGPTNNGVGI